MSPYYRSIPMILLVVAQVACATSGPAPDPIKEALVESRETVAAGIDEGFDESESIDEYVVSARLNPCRCEAPRHEIYVHGRWTRVYLDGDKKVLDAIDSAFASSQEKLQLHVLAVEGALSGDRSSPSGVDYPVFEVERHLRRGARESSTSTP